MKKALLYIAAALVAAGSMNAKTIDEVRIYLNPGHGSWGPNDRPMATISYPNLEETGRPDTCGFYESNTNLWKVLKLGNTLEKMGVKKENIMYSRVKNGPFPYVKGAEDAEIYNRNLTEICEEVDANNMDVFISVHSNAASEGTSTNYPLFLYRGSDGEGGDAVAGSRAMGLTMWPLFYTNAIDVMNYYGPTNPNVRGDVSFYGSSSDRVATNGNVYTGYLGVLKHGAQALLSEGYFHTYQPARHRALNQDYCFQEGVRYARGLCQVLGGTPETTGYIMGTVKDLHERFTGQELFKYAAGSDDQWTPINGAVVALYKGETKVAEYTVDNNYNGVFVFEGLEPGDYTLDVTAEGYKPLFDEYKAPIAVKANETSYSKVYLESEAYEPPSIVYTDYPDEINNPAIGVGGEYKFLASYGDAEIAELKDKTVRRAILRGNNLYVLAIDAEKAPYVYVIDADTHTVLKTLGTEGTEGTELAISDIQLTSDGVLVGCAMELCHYSDAQVNDGETRGETNFYKWENDENGIADGNPAVWFKTMVSGNFYRAYTGNTFLYKGTVEDGTIIVPSRTASAVKIFNNTLSIVEGALGSTGFNNKIGNIVSKDIFGTDYTYHLSPIEENSFIVTSSTHVARQIGFGETGDVYTDLAEGLVNTPSAKVSFFKHAGHSIMVTGDVVDDKPVTKLIDITNGLDKATLIGVKIEGETAASPVAATGRTIVNNDDEGRTLSAEIELVTVNEGATITKLTTEGQEQPKFINAYAYGLKAQQVEGKLQFDFNLSAAVDGARVILTNVATEEAQTIELGALEAGANTASLDLADLAEADYAWSVEVDNKSVATPGVYFSDASCYNNNNRGGVAVDNDPESPLFGNVYVSNGRSMGVQIFDAQLQAQGTYLTDKFAASNGSSPLRCAVSEGKLYLTDWSDAHAGVWMFDPQTNLNEVTNVFEGTIDGDGCIKNVNGVSVGGGTTGVGFYGKGAERKMYVFCEDYPQGNGQTAVGYDLGTADTWNVAPTYTFGTASAKMLNTNVEVNATSHGLFLSQVRGSGNNNTGAPAFVFANYNDEILVNAGTMTDLDGCNGAGLTVTPDESAMYIVDGSSKIRKYNITWTDDTPAFEEVYSFAVPKATELNQLKLDHAGNLYAYNRAGGLVVIALPKTAEELKVATPAAAVISVSGIDEVTAEVKAGVKVYPNPATDVVNVEAGEEITTLAIFNITGAQVSAPADIQGNKATIAVDNLPTGSYIVKVNKQAIQLIKK